MIGFIFTFAVGLCVGLGVRAFANIVYEEGRKCPRCGAWL